MRPRKSAKSLNMMLNILVLKVPHISEQHPNPSGAQMGECIRAKYRELLLIQISGTHPRLNESESLKGSPQVFYSFTPTVQKYCSRQRSYFLTVNFSL